jgi:predicted DNA-binding protein with PD1-like motif
MKSTQLAMGRTFLLAFDDGDQLLPSLTDFCWEAEIKQAIIPMFLAGLSEVDIVGTCEPVGNPDAPLWTTTRLHNVEAIGGGTVVLDEEGEMMPHIHISVGRKFQGAVGYTSHLKSARVAITGEMQLVEVLSPRLVREPDNDMYGVKLLDW